MTKTSVRKTVLIVSSALLIAAATLTSCARSSVRPSGPPPRSSLDLQELLNKANDHSRVMIPYGEYILPNGLTLKGREGLIISARTGTRILVEEVMDHIITIANCRNVRIENLFLRHVEPSPYYVCDGAEIKTDNCSNITIANCELSGCGAFGVWGDESSNLTIKDCYIHDNNNAAVYLSFCGSSRIENTRTEDNGRNIELTASDDPVMVNNQLGKTRE